MTIYFCTTNGCQYVYTAAVSRKVERAGRKYATGIGAKLCVSVILNGLLSEVVELWYVLLKWPNYCVLFENMITVHHNKT
jgi:hypothetical protein